ncbi:MAG: hypothetical protein ACI8S6_006079 [Myxococcota bacterium]
MSAISEVGPGRFRVDFSQLGENSNITDRVKAMFSAPAPKTVDLYRIGLAVVGVMAHSAERDVDGTLLAWNEYRIYLSRADYDRLRALQSRLQQGLDQRIREQLERMDARTIGDPVVRVLVDEETDLPRGTGEVLVSYVADEAMAPPGDGEMTVRVPSSRPRLLAAATERVVAAESVGPGLRLRWTGGEATIPTGQRVLVGRPHDGAPAGFIALTGASNRINSAQLHIEGSEEGVVISRPIRSNPVRVGGRLLQPGGRIVVTEHPITVELSNGELTVTVEQA